MSLNIEEVIPNADICLNSIYDEEELHVYLEICGELKTYKIVFKAIRFILKKEIRKIIFRKSKRIETF